MEIINEISNLSDISQNKRFSGFGVILDSTRASKLKNNPEHFTQIKIIDSTINPTLELDGPSKKYITLFIYWNQNEHNPFVHKIGDVIRFCNFDFETFQGNLQGKNKKGATWKIHQGDSMINDPYCHSVEFKEKTTLQHIARLQELRDWSMQFFIQNSLIALDWYSIDRLTNSSSSIQSFDMLLKIEDMRFSNDPASDVFTILFVDEKATKFKLSVSKSNKGILKPGDIVKVRSIEKIEGDVLAPFAKYHAILIIPEFFNDYVKFNETLKANEDLTRLKRENPEDGKIVHLHHHVGFDIEFFNKKGTLLEDGRTVSSLIADKWIESHPLQKFEDLVQDLSNESTDFEKKYHVRASLVDIQPRKIEDALRNQCKICKLFRRIDAVEGEVCCATQMEKVFLLRMLWTNENLEYETSHLVTYYIPEDGDINKNIFPELDPNQIKASEVANYQETWEELIEKHLEGDRVFDVFVKRFENDSLKEKSKFVPLRLFDTMFVQVLEN